MNNSVRIAKQLVRMARMLVAFNRSELKNQIKKKRSDLNATSLKEHLDCLEEMDAKEQKVALYWISKNRLILPEDLDKFNEAMNLINKQHLDFQEFEGPMEVINRNDKSTLRIKSQDAHFNPSSEKAFSNPYNAGDGVVVYEVKDSKKGQLTVRRAIDVNWGYDKNPWCLIARKDGFDQNEINALSEEQAEKLGLYSDDALAVAWNYWKRYSAYPKRIAFKSGKLLAFSAGRKKQHVEWWDKNDESHYTIPGSNAVDDIEFLKRYGKLNLLDSKNASPEIFEELAEDEDWSVRQEVAWNPNTSVEILMQLAKDEEWCVRYGVAMNLNTPVEVILKLAEDEDVEVRMGVAKNPNTPIEVLMKLAEDEYLSIKQGVIRNPNTPVEILSKLTADEDWHMRQEVSMNSNTPAEALIKLADDKKWGVRYGVAMNPSTPAEILRKLAEDEDARVRCEVARNPNTPVEVILKLSEDKEESVRRDVAKNPNTPVEILSKLTADEDWHVRIEVAMNPNTPAEILRKLAEDEDARVREKVKRYLKQ